MRRWRLHAGIWAAVLLAPATAAWAGLNDEVRQAIRAAQLPGAVVAVSVRDADSDKALVAVDADRLMIPASNMKLLTSGAALQVLGPDFHFRTCLRLDGDRLIVAGDGDPGFGDPVLLEQTRTDQRVGMDVEEFLKLWTKAVSLAGITRLREVVVDDRIFDRQFTPPDWPADQLNQSYCAETAGLSFHANVLHFFPKPVKGQPANISDIRPRSSWLTPTNRTTCRTAPQDINSTWIARQTGTNRLTVFGNVKFPYRAAVPVTIHHVPQYFAQLLASRLRDSGVKVDAWRAAGPEDPPDLNSEGVVIGPVIQTPISTALERCNRDSHNLYAECLMKRMGAEATHQPGSWLNGGNVLRHAVHARLNDPQLSSRLVVTDGSGMSRTNQVAPALLTAWLNSFHRDTRLGPMLIASLAVAGSSGTIQERFATVDLAGATVHAKTGYINQVSCLSGFVTARDGQRRSFSIMVNALTEPGSVARAKRMQEAIVSSIARDLAAAAARVGGD